METISNHLLRELFTYIPLSDLLNSLQYTCKRFYSVVQSRGFLNQAIELELHTLKSLNLSQEECIRFIGAHLLQPRPADLKFFGFATNGGIDEEDQKFWVSNLFKRSEHSYSSRSYKENVNCAAVLSSTQTTMQAKSQAKRDIEKILRNVLLKNGVPYGLVKKLKLVKSLKGYASNFSMDELFRNEENAATLKKDVYEKLNFIQQKVVPRALRRRDNDLYILEDSVNHSITSKCNSIACVRQIDISRHGRFTCPVGSLMVFISDGYIDVTSTDFDIFNNLRSKSDVKSLCESRNLKYIDKNTAGTNCRVIEFLPTYSNLKPILWLGYKTNNLDKTTRISLTNWFSGVYAYVKLIYAHNRMAEEDWHHDDTNIDCKFVIMRGCELNLSSS
jgi:hypothetical protein